MTLPRPGKPTRSHASRESAPKTKGLTMTRILKVLQGSVLAFLCINACATSRPTPENAAEFAVRISGTLNNYGSAVPSTIDELAALCRESDPQAVNRALELAFSPTYSDFQRESGFA